MAEGDQLNLSVGELTNRSESGRGIVRVDTKTMSALGIKEGDVIELHGKKQTAAIAVRAYPADVGLNIIRMDGITRRNSGVGVGETIKITKAEIKDAEKVVLAPAQKGVVLQMNPQLLKKNMFMRPVVEKDIVTPFPVVKQRRDGPFGDFFGIDIEDMFFTPVPGETKLVVVSTKPDGIVRIADVTEIQLRKEAVDLELTGIPTMTYEDLGGLHEEISKIREMVELPLRHPELFNRLGIEPPKGVLLYGPPGTGKTLLAKAVANESGANFISVSGPEFISKWYGQSLVGGEELLVMEDGKVKRMSIKYIVENEKHVSVISFDKGGKVKFSKIKDYFKHPKLSKIMEVKTKTGRKIKVTDFHSLFTLQDGKLKSMKTSDLKVKDSYILIPRKVPSPELDVELNLMDMFDDYLVKECSKYVKQAKEKIGLKRTAEILEVKSKYVYDIIGKNIGVKIKKFKRLMKVAKIKYDFKKIKISSKFSHSLPVKLKITPELCRLFGLYVSEGDYNKRNIRISNTLKEVKEDIKNTCEKLGIPCSVYEKSTVIHSKLLMDIMEKIGFNRYAKQKRIAPLIYSLKKDLKKEFLRGYYSGDGSIYPNQRDILTIEATTYSEGLANDLLYLLLQIGIVASVYSNKVKGYNSIRNRVCFRGAQNIKRFKGAGFLDKKRQKKLESYKVDWNRSDQIPIFQEIKDLLEKNKVGKEWLKSKTIGRDKLKEFLTKANVEKTNKLWNIADNDLYFDRVENIQEIDCDDKYVYDVSINPTENFLAGFGGIFAHNSEANLRKIFKDAEKNAPSIIFIDEIDAIAPKREETRGEVEKRVVSQLLTLMDGLKSRGKVIVIAATNRHNAVDPALRRPGRFDRELEIGVPDQKGRKEVLQIHTRNMPLTKNVDLNWLSSVTYGFVGADLEALAKEAAMAALRRILPKMNWKEQEELPEEILGRLKVSKQDFKTALRMVGPSAMREVLIEIPNVKWENVGGLDDIKETLKEIVQWPLLHPEAFKRIGIHPPAGMLLYGPPGTGKTLLAKAVANESGANFISVKGPELLSMYVGESEKHIREVFRRAKQVAPSIIFFDEIDSLAPRRGSSVGTHVMENVVSQILVEMSGLEDLHNVVVIAATNRPDIMDPALLRPGRFERQVFVPAPEEHGRLEIFKVHTINMPLAKNVDLKRLAKQTEGYTGADIEAVCREAGLTSLRHDMKSEEVSNKNFTEALKTIRPSVDPKLIEFYKEMSDKIRKGITDQKKDETSYLG